MIPATHRGEPQRGHHLGQPVGRAVGLGGALRRGRGARRSIWRCAAQRLGVAAESLSDRGRHHRRPRQPAHQLLGAGRRRAAGARRHAPGSTAKAPAARRVAGTPAARLDLPDKVFGRPRFMHDLALPGLLHGRVLKPAAPGRQADVARRSRRARRLPASSPWCATAASSASSPRPRAAAEAGLAALRKGAAWSAGDGAARRDATSPPGSRASPPRPPPSTSARPPCRAQVGPHDPPAVHAALHRACLDGALLRHRAVDRRGQGAGLVALPGRLQSARRPGARLAAAAREHRRRARRGRRLLRPQRRRRRGVRRGAAGARGRRAPGARAMVARGRARLVADGRRHGHRDRGRPRRAAARSSAGAATCGATATSRAPGARRSRPCSPPRSWPSRSSASSPSIRRWPTAAGRSATPSRSTTCPPGASPATALLTMPIRTSALRTLGAFANVFAIESFMDELAAERGEDPLAFRLRHLKDPRARAVLEAAAARAGWSSRRKRDGVGPRHRLCPLQELRRLLRRGGGGRGRAPTSACAGWWWRSTSARSSIRTASPTRSRAAPSRRPAGR